ncbi:MAG TPA: hypothetical protein VH207_04440, partial [Chthoniobacterales bacterium]|nr:hypothetical protein [Chthoniobacterales bacterium]
MTRASPPPGATSPSGPRFMFVGSKSVLDSNERLNYLAAVMAEEIHATKVAILNATERLVAAHGFG